MNDSERFTVAAPAGTCPECGTRFDGAEQLRRHMQRHTGVARGSDDAGGTVPKDQQADNGAGRVQTE